RELDRGQRLVLLKMLTGELRLGVSQTLVVRALAETARLPTTTIAARMMGDWPTTAEWFSSLTSHETTTTDLSRPYPFYLAAPLSRDCRRRFTSARRNRARRRGAGVSR